MALSSPNHALLRDPLGCFCLRCMDAFPLFLARFSFLPTSPLDPDQPSLGQGSGCCLHPSGGIAHGRRWLCFGRAAPVVPRRLSKDIPLTVFPSQCVCAAWGRAPAPSVSPCPATLGAAGRWEDLQRNLHPAQEQHQRGCHKWHHVSEPAHTCPRPIFHASS